MKDQCNFKDLMYQNETTMKYNNGAKVTKF